MLKGMWGIGIINALTTAQFFNCLVTGPGHQFHIFFFKGFFDIEGIAGILWY